MSCDCFDISLKSLRNCWLSGSALTVSAISQRLIYTQPASAGSGLVTEHGLPGKLLDYFAGGIKMRASIRDNLVI